MIVWDVARGEISEELSGHRGEVWGLAVSPDGRTLYSGAYDGQAILWDLSGDRRLLRYFPVDPPFRVPDTPRGLAPSPDGETLALTHSDGAVDLIDTRTLRRRDSLLLLGSKRIFDLLGRFQKPLFLASQTVDLRLQRARLSVGDGRRSHDNREPDE